MKIYQFTILICLCMLQNIVFAQTGKINGTYQWDMTEYLTISGDSFKLHIYPIAWSLYGLNKEDTILAEGKVQYESDNFIKLVSKNYEREAEKNMTIIESIDSCLIDSIRFNFIFPFDGKYKITLYFGRNYENNVEVKNRKEMVLPAYRDSILTFSFYILNQTPVESSHYNYLKTIKFSSFLNAIKNKKSNSFEISIPYLTSSFFNRRLINGEYIKVSKEKDGLFWHNEEYEKFCSYPDID